MCRRRNDLIDEHGRASQHSQAESWKPTNTFPIFIRGVFADANIAVHKEMIIDLNNRVINNELIISLIATDEIKKLIHNITKLRTD